MSRAPTVVVALSGGVDSAVAALLLRDSGLRVECLHMTNWEDDGHCEAADDLQFARRVARQLDLPLHRVSFAADYAEQVFADFLTELRAGRTPNPDVLCNRHIKFGSMLRYAERLGADQVATGHYARLASVDGQRQLYKAADPSKDQSYFLHAVGAAAFERVVFPIGAMTKNEVRRRARAAGLAPAEKKDSTGICFIGERHFPEFLARYLAPVPGPIQTPDGTVLGEHQGVAFYTLGQRHGLSIGGRRGFGTAPWFVAAKDIGTNTLTVVQGATHPLLYQNWLAAEHVHWINGIPAAWRPGGALRCRAKTRYRQPDQACEVLRTGPSSVEVRFEQPQRAVTPGQFVVFYQGERCLGGGTITTAAMRELTLEAAG
jgi:tRNA-specific 2-thiouridylase